MEQTMKLKDEELKIQTPLVTTLKYILNCNLASKNTSLLSVSAVLHKYKTDNWYVRSLEKTWTSSIFNISEKTTRKPSPGAPNLRRESESSPFQIWILSLSRLRPQSLKKQNQNS
eukprot:09240_4